MRLSAVLILVFVRFTTTTSLTWKNNLHQFTTAQPVTVIPDATGATIVVQATFQAGRPYNVFSVPYDQFSSASWKNLIATVPNAGELEYTRSSVGPNGDLLLINYADDGVQRHTVLASPPYTADKWKHIPSINTTYAPASIAGNSQGWLAFVPKQRNFGFECSMGSLYFSSNGISWQEVNDPQLNLNVYCAMPVIAQPQGGFILITSNNSYYQWYGHTWHSPDGLSWFPVPQLSASFKKHQNWSPAILKASSQLNSTHFVQPFLATKPNGWAGTAIVLVDNQTDSFSHLKTFSQQKGTGSTSQPVVSQCWTNGPCITQSYYQLFGSGTGANDWRVLTTEVSDVWFGASRDAISWNQGFVDDRYTHWEATPTRTIRNAAATPPSLYALHLVAGGDKTLLAIGQLTPYFFLSTNGGATWSERLSLPWKANFQAWTNQGSTFWEPQLNAFVITTRSSLPEKIGGMGKFGLLVFDPFTRNVTHATNVQNHGGMPTGWAYLDGSWVGWVDQGFIYYGIAAPSNAPFPKETGDWKFQEIAPESDPSCWLSSNVVTCGGQFVVVWIPNANSATYTLVATPTKVGLPKWVKTGTVGNIGTPSQNNQVTLVRGADKQLVFQAAGKFYTSADCGASWNEGWNSKHLQTAAVAFVPSAPQLGDIWVAPLGGPQNKTLFWTHDTTVHAQWNELPLDVPFPATPFGTSPYSFLQAIAGNGSLAVGLQVDYPVQNITVLTLHES